MWADISVEINPVLFFNRTKDLGSVRRGKLADLVLLDGDPLIDIGNTKRVAAVVVNGRLVDGAERKKILDQENGRRNPTRK